MIHNQVEIQQVPRERAHAGVPGQAIRGIGDRLARRERELEIRLMERRFGGAEVCPYCAGPVEADYIVCPSCSTPLRERCTGCSRPLDPTWVVCPYCAAKPAPRA